MDDWRAQLSSATRKRNVNRIVKTLKTSHSFGDEDVLVELQKVAQNIEDKTYAGAASKFDYSKQISSKLRSMEISLKSMDTNNWRPNQGTEPNMRPNQGTEPNMETTDWRGQLQPESRQRIVNKIMDTLKKHLPVSGQEGLHELRKIAQRFEEKIFTAATSQTDYLRKISLKMVTMETKSQGTMANNIPSNQVGPSNKPPDTGFEMKPWAHYQAQSHA